VRISVPLVLFTVLAGAWLLLVSKPPSKPAQPAEPARSPAVPTLDRAPPGSYLEAVLDEARALSPERISRLENDLQTTPGDTHQRALLIAALWLSATAEAAARRAVHVLWLIENAPGSEFLDWPPARFQPTEIDPDRYNALLGAWRRAIARHPFDPRTGLFAARWVGAHDPRPYVEFLQASLEAQPDFGPSIDALGAWCADNIARGTVLAAEARRLLEHSLNPELQIRAARRFHERILDTQLQGKADLRLAEAARECLRRARIVAPYLDEDLAYSVRSSDDGLRPSPGDPLLPEFRLVLNAGWKQMQRLPVESFPELPPTVAVTLGKMGCTIPQSFAAPGRSGPHNVIRGTFCQPGQESWAALCSVQGTVRLLVFEDAADESPETLQGGLEIQRMQGIAEGRAGFDWLITAAGANQIRRYHQAYGGPPLPELDHDGIESHILGKASVILYRYRGKWLRLQGAD